MQDRYAGDIGDFIKFALLRELAQDRNLGVAWYLFPDEGHNSDGGHTEYLDDPGQWRDLDSDLFDALKVVVGGERSVRALENVVPLRAVFSRELLNVRDVPWRQRSEWRNQWFQRTCENLRNADLVFADPDNGIVDDDRNGRSRWRFGKQIPMSEVNALASGRPAIIYHHNTRWRGGHDEEVSFWLQKLGNDTIAIRARPYSSRTFFILHPDDELRRRAGSFCERWRNHKISLQSRSVHCG